MTIDASKFQKIAVVTGAGISAPSGLPTFRGKDDSLWNDEDFMNKSHINYIRSHVDHVDEMWGYWRPFREGLATVEPNPAHYALAIAGERQQITIGTQNIDGLHQKAGSHNVYELHGTLFEDKCLDECQENEFGNWNVNAWPAGEHDACPECGGPIRPNAVFFGEFLPQRVVAAVEKAVIECDLFMMVGTSGIVYPVAGYVDVASKWGKPTLLVNDQEWDHPYPFTEKIFGDCAEILPELFGVN